MRVLVIFICFLGILASPALANKTSDEGVQKLEALFTSILDYQTQSLAKDRKQLTLKGKLNIEKEKNYYAVTLPPIEIKDEDDYTLKLGSIAMNVSPTKNKEDWVLSAALPTPIFIADENNRVVEQITIGKQKFNAHWDQSLEVFSKIEITYEDVRYKQERTDTVYYVQKMVISSLLNEKSKGKVTGPFYIYMKNIFSGTSSRPTKNTIEEIRLNFVFEDMPIGSLLKRKPIFNIDDYGTFLMRGTVKQIKSKLDLGSLTFEYGFKKPEDNVFDQNLKFGYRGADLVKNKDNYVDLLPKNIEINLDLNKLPYQDLAYILQTKVVDGQASALGLMGFVKSLSLLPSKMARAGTIFNIDTFDFENDIYDLDVKGSLKASDISPLAVTGDVKMTVQGLNQTEDIIQKKIKTAEPEHKNILEKALRQINFIQAFCLNDDDLYTCNITLDEEGQIKINKKSASDALGTFIKG